MSADQHPADYVLKSRSTGKYLAVCASGFFLTYRLNEAEYFCECCAQDAAGVAANIFNMGFRVIEVTNPNSAPQSGQDSHHARQPSHGH